MKSKPKDLIGKKCYEVLHKSNKPWPNCPFECTKNDKKSHLEEVDDKNVGIPILVSVSPVFDDKGEVSGAVHIAKDITERKKTEEEIKKKIQDLERFQKVAVDRELKMIELKKRISDLETKIKEK